MSSDIVHSERRVDQWKKNVKLKRGWLDWTIAPLVADLAIVALGKVTEMETEER